MIQSLPRQAIFAVDSSSFNYICSRPGHELGAVEQGGGTFQEEYISANARPREEEQGMSRDQETWPQLMHGHLRSLIACKLQL